MSMLLPTEPRKCPTCKKSFGFYDVDRGEEYGSGINLSGNFSSGCGTYIHAEGEVSIKSNNDVVLNVSRVVTALKGASVEMNNPFIDKSPIMPPSLTFKNIEISPPRRLVLLNIVANIIGVERTKSLEPEELKTLFLTVQNRIHNGFEAGLNSGSLTGIRRLHSFGDVFLEIMIIDDDGMLTDNGVELFKLIANQY